MLDSFIDANRSEIVGHCVQELQLRYPDRGDEDLGYGFASFIDEVITALREDARDSNQTPNTTFGATTAAAHAIVRKRQGFDLSRVIHDYGLVCDSITELLHEHDERPSAREFQILNRCVDEAVSQAAEAFWSETHEDDQQEKVERLAFLAHEIRNAVSSANMAFELIRYGRVAVDGRTAEVVQRGLARISTLVDRTLAEARLSVEVVARREWFRLSDLLEQVVAQAVRERDIRVELAADPELEIEADSNLLDSAIGNLIQNAIKFSHDGAVVVVRATREGEAVMIEIEDRCGGLADSDHARLFEPFYKSSADRRGLGLGLAIARRAVEAHGGTLEVRNLPGLGCVFSIVLPRTTRILDCTQ
jgi:signal transduction histidine kinase